MNIAVETPLNTPTAQLATWVETLGERLAQRDVDGALELFAEECHWRDLLLFSWNLVTWKASLPSGICSKRASTRLVPGDGYWKVRRR